MANIINNVEHVGIIARLYKVLATKRQMDAERLAVVVQDHFPEYRDADTQELARELEKIVSPS